MIRRLTTATLTLILLVAVAVPVLADETPRGVWIKSKCALCHGEDGASATPAGKQTKAPDLRTAEFQKLPDSQVAKLVTDGHSKMPSFKALSAAQVNLLVIYLHSLRPATPKK